MLAGTISNSPLDLHTAVLASVQSNQWQCSSENLNNDWVWDKSDCSSNVILSANQRSAYFHTDPVTGSTGTAGVRGSKGFVDGDHYWEVRFMEPPQGTSVMVGVATKDASLHTDNCQYVNLIGKDDEGWGLNYKGQTWHGGQSTRYCAAFYEEDTVVGIHLNLYTGTLSFYHNGHHLGVAFTGLNLVGRPLYPVISSTSVNTELEVTGRFSQYLTLQEKCFFTVAKQLRNHDDISKLPLPVCFKRHLLAIK